MFVFALASGVYPRLELARDAACCSSLLAMLAVGVGMLLSVLFVRFRDIQPIWDVSSQILFYALADHLPGATTTRRAGRDAATRPATSPITRSATS